MFQLPYVSVFYLCFCVCANLVVLALFFPLLCVVLDILCIKGNKGILNLNLNLYTSVLLYANAQVCIYVCMYVAGLGSTP